MDPHKELDKAYHAKIASIYDYITNEPRAYPNELLFRPIDKHVPNVQTLVDLGCGTGQMFLRYKDRAEKIIAVDHSGAMLAEAKRKAAQQGLQNVTFIQRDLDDFLATNTALRADLVTCVGVLHHLEQEGLSTFLNAVFGIVKPRGYLLVAEPIYSNSVPSLVHERNSRSILVDRLKECIPPDTQDPDEEPLRESSLLTAIAGAGFKIVRKTKGFELFHVTEPISQYEKLIIQWIYWRYRDRGDVVALLLGK